MQCWLGQKMMVDPLRLTAQEFYPWDFAVSLSRINRYCGNGRFPYSVAQHCVLLSFAVPEHLALAALLHDAAEAIVGDINGLVKAQCPQLIEFEEKVQRRIGKICGIPYEDFLAIGPWDKRIRFDEMKALFEGFECHPGQLLGVRIVHVTESMARSMWLDRFNHLFTKDYQ